MPEFLWMDRQRDPVMRHLDRVAAGRGLVPRGCRTARPSILAAVLGPASDVLPPQSSIPTILRLPPFPARTSTDPVFASRSDPLSVSASLIRKPAHQRIAISARSLSAYRPGPASRITRMISWTVGGSAG